MKKITFCILMLLWICSNIQVVGQVKEPQIREDGAYMQKSEKQEKATLQGVW